MTDTADAAATLAAEIVMVVRRHPKADVAAAAMVLALAHVIARQASPGGLEVALDDCIALLRFSVAGLRKGARS